MPKYSFKCKNCDYKDTRVMPIDEIRKVSAMPCPMCDGLMIRDYRAEGATNTFKPTRDLYAQKKGM